MHHNFRSSSIEHNTLYSNAKCKQHFNGAFLMIKQFVSWTFASAIRHFTLVDQTIFNRQKFTLVQFLCVPMLQPGIPAPLMFVLLKFRSSQSLCLKQHILS